MTARPAPEDSRVALARFLDDVYDEFDLPSSYDIADAMLARYLVLDPSSPELVERIAREIARGKGYLAMHSATQEHYRERARAVLAALAAPGGEGS